MSRIAFIGLGQIGAPIAARLAASGDARIHAFDSAPSPESLSECAAAGIVVESSAVAAARGADIVITVLPTSAVVEAVIMADDFLDSVSSGALFIDMTSSYPPQMRRVGSALAQRGFRLVDAPICNGGVAGAIAGTLTVVIGGEVDDKALARQVLGPAASNILDAGPLGCGHVVKIVSNLIANGVGPLVAEAFALGSAGGVSRELLSELLRSCAASNWVAVDKLVPAADLDLAGRGTFRADLAAKDIRYASDLAGTSLVPHLIADAVQHHYILASHAGYGSVEARWAPWAYLSNGDAQDQFDVPDQIEEPV